METVELNVREMMESVRAKLVMEIDQLEMELEQVDEGLAQDEKKKIEI